MEALYAEVEDHIQQYENGTITVSEDIEFSMRQTVKQITHYILSKYMGGQIDPKTKARKPFRNIGNAIVDLEWRAKNIDRKSIEAHATDGDYLFSMIVQKELHQWMKDNNFGETIDAFQRKESEYGSVLLKKTETKDELIIEPVNWGTMVVDPRDIQNGMKVDKNYLSPLELKAKRGIWDEQYEGVSAIDAVLTAAKKAYKSEKGENRIEVLDIEGQFEARSVYPDAYADDDTAGDEINLYNLIVAVVKNKKFCLFKTKLTESRYKHKARKTVEDRDMGMGVWEEIFEAQIFTNEMVIDEREAINLGGKIVTKSNKKNMPSAMELMNGENIQLDEGEFFDAVQLRSNSLPDYSRVIDAWFLNMQRDQSAFNGITGEEPKASTPGISLELQAAQGASIFNKRRDSDGFFLGDIIIGKTEDDYGWVMPFLVKRINKDHKLTASYSKKELELLDRDIREWHVDRKSRHAVLGVKADGPLTSPLMPEGFPDQGAYAAEIQDHLNKQGNKRTLHIPKGYITLEKIKTKVRFDITDEMSDDQRRLNAIAGALAQLPPGDPQRSPLVAEAMEISGISAASFPVNAAASAPGNPSKPKPTRTNDVLPAGQQ